MTVTFGWYVDMSYEVTQIITHLQLLKYYNLSGFVHVGMPCAITLLNIDMNLKDLRFL